MITLNIVNIIILLLGMLIIWVLNPDREEMMILKVWFFEAIWIIIWVIVFPIMGHGVHMSMNISFY